MSKILQLENYFLTQLRMHFHFPEKGEGQVQEMRLDFDYDAFQHNEQPLRRLLRLRVSASERGPDDQKVGHDIECEINGQFLVPEELEPEKQEAMLRVNGLSILYSTLRGILGNVTGSFPGDRLCLPTILPQDVINSIEARKSEDTPGATPPPAKKSKTRKTRKKAAKKSPKSPTK